MFDETEEHDDTSRPEAALTQRTLEQQLAEASTLIDLQAGKITAARRALQQDQPKHALDILS